MQKYSPISDDEPNMREDSERGTYYWCADADARIAELEGALQDCEFALRMQREALQKWASTVNDVMAKAQKMLALRAGS